jgi:hypothetical protein
MGNDGQRESWSIWLRNLRLKSSRYLVAATHHPVVLHAVLSASCRRLATQSLGLSQTRYFRERGNLGKGLFSYRGLYHLSIYLWCAGTYPMVRAYDFDFSCMGGNVAIPRLESCPKCEGQLLLERDNYGLYQQCLQCGYLHDLQTFTMLDNEEIEDEKELVGSRRVPVNKGMRDVSQNTPPLFEPSRSPALANPLDF